MMYLRLDLVMNHEVVRTEPEGVAYTEFTDIIRYVPFDVKTKNGIIGDATLGTAEKGRQIVEKSVEPIVQYMEYEF